jgi:hypothetical protein
MGAEMKKKQVLKKAMETRAVSGGGVVTKGPCMAKNDEVLAVKEAYAEFKQAAAELIARESESSSLSPESAARKIDLWLSGCDSSDVAYSELLNDPDLQLLTKCNPEYYHEHWKVYKSCMPTDKELEALPIGFWTGFFGETDSNDGTGALSFSSLNKIAEQLGVHTLQLTEPGTQTMYGRMALNAAMIKVQHILGPAGKIGPYFNAWSALYARRAFSMWKRSPQNTQFVIFSTKEAIFSKGNQGKFPLEGSYVYTTELPRMKAWLDEWRAQTQPAGDGGSDRATDFIRAKFVHIGPSTKKLEEVNALIESGDWDAHFKFTFEQTDCLEPVTTAKKRKKSQ